MSRLGEKAEKSESDSRFLSRKYIKQLALTAVLAVSFFIPHVLSTVWKSPLPRVGEIAQKDIISPISFKVPKDEDSLKAEIEAVKRSVPIVLAYNDKIADSVLAEFAKRWEDTKKIIRDRRKPLKVKRKELRKIWEGLSKSDIDQMLLISNPDDFGRIVTSELRREYHDGFMAAIPEKEEEYSNAFTILRGKRSKTVPASMVPTDSSVVAELKKSFAEHYPKKPKLAELSLKVAKLFLVPNLIVDTLETEKRREEAAKKVVRVKYEVSKGEKIVGKHEKIDEEAYLKLKALYKELKRKSSFEYPLRQIIATGGVFVILVVISFFFSYIVFKRWNQIWCDFRKFVALVVPVIIIGLLGTVFYVIGLTIYSIPFMFVVMISFLLFDQNLALLTILTTIMLAIIGIFGNATFAVAALITSITLIFSERVVTVRNRLFGHIIVSAALGVFALIVLNMVKYVPSGDILDYSVEFLASALISPIVALFTLPFFERYSGMVSDITLIDLSDINSGLLQRLSVEAPGTFTHSIMVGNMAAAAAEEVGANPVLARVGGYYHDIGKLVNPEYFIENKSGRNPHEKLQPHESKKIIVSHIENGVKIAKENKLPQPIIDIIEQHHGTSIIDYFYELAKKGDSDVDAEEFRYPGPKPKTLEATIVMICDIVEASLRSQEAEVLENESKCKKLVEELIKAKIDDGQFDESEIKIGQIKRIIERILPLARKTFHKRVSYNLTKEV